MKYIYLFILLISISLASAETIESLGLVKQNDCISLKQASSGVNGCNITSVLYPNKTQSMGINIMTKTGIEFNKTYCQTEVLGTYIVIGFCYNGTESVPWGYDFEVTTTGEQVSLSNIIIVLVFIFLGILTFILGYMFDNSKFIIKSVFYLFSLLFGLLAMNSARIIASESTNLSSMSETGLIFIIAICLVMFLYTFIYWMIQTFQALKNKKEIRWNY